VKLLNDDLGWRTECPLLVSVLGEDGLATMERGLVARRAGGSREVRVGTSASFEKGVRAWVELVGGGEGGWVEEVFAGRGGELMGKGMRERWKGSGLKGEYGQQTGWEWESRWLEAYWGWSSSLQSRTSRRKACRRAERTERPLGWSRRCHRCRDRVRQEMIEPKSRQRHGVAREVAAAVAELRSEREMMSKRLLAVASALAS
jgi:hypothetical protein